MAGQADGLGAGGDGGTRRRRRRRRRSRRGEGAPEQQRVGEDTRPDAGVKRAKAWARDGADPVVSLASTAKVPRVRLPIQAPRNGVASPTARRRRLGRTDMEDFAQYLEQLNDDLVGFIYSGMGGQPKRVAGKDRMIQLAVRAIAQGNRMGNLVRSLHQRDRQALAILVQCGGTAHHEELKSELALSLGGNEREWAKVIASLCEKGLLAATEERGDDWFVVIPAPLIEHIAEHLAEDLSLPGFDQPDVRVIDERPFCPPFGFSLTTLATYIDQRPPRLTQRQEVFKVHKDEMDKFFSQLWAPDSELFTFHLDFLMQHGMVELKGDRLAVNRAVIEEWLQLDAEDQLDLVFSSLEKRLPMAEWVLWAVHGVGGVWVPERPLQAIYRRWRRGEEWRERSHKPQWSAPRAAMREGFSFTPLVNAGMLELGQWGQEKFYRLTPRAQRLLETASDEGFSKFYLTPSFEIMAPAGMAPLLFFRIGELAELTACDRANTYKITEVTIEQALEKGWRRDDVLEFLRDYSQIGLPDNVEQTLRGWMGHHGDVEFHDVLLLTVHRSQIRRLETHRRLKPFLLHRFVPGMYAVDRSRLDQLNEALSEVGFTPIARPRQYPDDPLSVEARERLLMAVATARDERADLVGMAVAADSDPEALFPVPGCGQAARKARKKRDDVPQRRTPVEIRELAERAIATGQQLDMLYVTRDNQRKTVRVVPERIAVNTQGSQVLVARDVIRNERLSYQLIQIERMAPVESGA